MEEERRTAAEADHISAERRATTEETRIASDAALLKQIGKTL